jgi:predicted nucleic acid-binding protein
VARVPKITRRPTEGRNYYVVDACFLANWAIPRTIAPPGQSQDAIDKCMEWWAEIEAQLKSGHARVYVPDICIAETFKVLAKKYYDEGWFPTAVAMNNARNRLRKFISTPTSTLKAAKRTIRFHDVPTTRDIIVAIDRFYELFHKHKLGRVSVPDLILVSTAKYLVDFFDLPRPHLHIVTMDKALRKGSRKIQELPNAYDPTEAADAAAKVFQ